MTPTEYSDLALQLIRTHAAASEQGITAAQLGKLLRRSDPNIDWKTLGYPTLKRFLEALQERELVQLGETTKGALSVSPKSKPFALEAPAGGAKPRTFNPLRKPFWVAFVIDQPRGRRFFHRPTGNIRMGTTEPPKPRDEWVEIPLIPEQMQREWAEDFLKRQSLRKRPEFTDTFGDPEWVKTLPKQLAVIDLSLAKDWNRLRSVRVSEAVQLWCSTNGVSPLVAFQSEERSPRVTDSRPAQARGAATAPRSARARVLAALGQMPTEFLLEIPIPAKYLLAPDHVGNGS